MKKNFYFQDGGAPKAFGVEAPNIELASASPLLNAVSMPVDSGVNTYLQFQQEDRYKKQFEANMKQQEAVQQQQQIDNMYKQATMDKGLVDDVLKIPIFGRNADGINAAKQRFLSGVQLDDHTPQGFAKRLQAYNDVMRDPAVLDSMRDQMIDKSLNDNVSKLSEDEKNASDFYTRYQPEYIAWKNGTGNQPTPPKVDPVAMQDIIAQKQLKVKLGNEKLKYENQQTELENKNLQLKQPLIEAQARIEQVKATIEEADIASSGILDTYKEYEKETDPAKKAELVKKMKEQIKIAKGTGSTSEIKSVEAALGYAFEEDIKAGIPPHQALAKMAKAKLQFERGHGGGGTPKETVGGITPEREKAELKKQGWDGVTEPDITYTESKDGQGNKVIEGEYIITQSTKPNPSTGWFEDTKSGTWTKTIHLRGSKTDTGSSATSGAPRTSWDPRGSGTAPATPAKPTTKRSW